METSERVPQAIEALTVHQHQLDETGIMAGVSREAIDVVIRSHAGLVEALEELVGVTPYHDDDRANCPKCQAVTKARRALAAARA